MLSRLPWKNINNDNFIFLNMEEKLAGWLVESAWERLGGEHYNTLFCLQRRMLFKICRCQQLFIHGKRNLEKYTHFPPPPWNRFDWCVEPALTWASSTGNYSRFWHVRRTFPDRFPDRLQRSERERRWQCTVKWNPQHETLYWSWDLACSLNTCISSEAWVRVSVSSSICFFFLFVFPGQN